MDITTSQKEHEDEETIGRRATNSRGLYSVKPWIISRDTAKLLDFMSKAFGTQELRRVYNEDGTIGHAEAKLGDCIVMAFDARKDASR